MWAIFVVKKFPYSSKSMSIEHTKYFQHTYYVIEHELNYRRVGKILNTNILHTNISQHENFPNYGTFVMYMYSVGIGLSLLFRYASFLHESGSK